MAITKPVPLQEAAEARLAEIKEQLKEYRALVAEQEAWQAALDALEKKQSAKPSAAQPSRRRAAGGGDAAKREQDRKRIVETVKKQPGITMDELKSRLNVDGRMIGRLKREEVLIVNADGGLELSAAES
jgi:hypothetical protein